MINKSTLRKHFLAKRNRLSAQKVKQLSRDVCRQILSTSFFKKTDNIACYSATFNEVTLTPLFNELAHVFLPVIKPNRKMVFSRYTSVQELVKNKYGIFEPNSQQIIAAKEIAVCLLPLVAFNRQGMRLGMGGGYYDRYFEHNKDNKIPTKLIGIAYDFQESDTIQAQSWDIPLDAIITNKEVITP